MAAAVADQDLPFDDGVSCGVGAFAGIIFDVEECRRQGGLFFRIVCRDKVEIDVTPERVKISNDIAKTEVWADKVYTECKDSTITVNEESVTLDCKGSNIVVKDGDVSVEAPLVNINSTVATVKSNVTTVTGLSVELEATRQVVLSAPDVIISGGLRISGGLNVASATIGGIDFATHVHSLEEGTTGGPSGPSEG